jgi:hypothetical protein
MVDRLVRVERRERVDVGAVVRIDPGADDFFWTQHR